MTLRLLSFSNVIAGYPLDEAIETAILHFIDMFRSIYIGDQSQRASRIFDKLEQGLGVSDQKDVLEVILKKMYFLSLLLMSLTRQDEESREFEFRGGQQERRIVSRSRQRIHFCQALAQDLPLVVYPREQCLVNTSIPQIR